MIDLSSQTTAELRRLQTKIDVEIRRRTDHAKKNFLKRMEKLAAEEGLRLSDVLGAGMSSDSSTPVRSKRAPRGESTAPRKEKLPPVYFDPDNPKVGWSGKGRKPNWVLRWLDAGNNLEDLRRSA